MTKEAQTFPDRDTDQCQRCPKLAHFEKEFDGIDGVKWITKCEPFTEQVGKNVNCIIEK